MKHESGLVRAVLERLAAVGDARARASARRPGGGGVRRGRVRASRAPDGTVTLEERGVLALDDGPELPYRDALRFAPADGGRALDVAHLRRGADHPVPLVRLVERGGALVSEAPHRCGEDRYALIVRAEAGEVELAWTIRGPRKDSSIVVRYRPEDHE